MQRRYLLKVVINGRTLTQVQIDDHYEKKHSDTINDPLILEMVKTLNGRTYAAEDITPSGWEIYKTDPVFLGEKIYRLIWCLHPDEAYVGVINAFRRKTDGKVSQ